MAQKTAWTGAVLTESDINTYLMHEGGAWTTYTPTLTQSATVAKTTAYGSYARLGRTIIGNTRLVVTGTGTAANAIVVGLPVAAAATVAGVIGSAFVFDTSAGLEYVGAVVVATTTTVNIYGGGGVGSALGAAQMTAALAVGDVVTMSFSYEAAT